MNAPKTEQKGNRMLEGSEPDKSDRSPDLEVSKGLHHLESYRPS
jgi:hypothetical protein